MLPVDQPYELPPSLTAPRAQPPPSEIPVSRLATQADNWAQGRGASPALPPPAPAYAQAYTQAQQNAPPPQAWDASGSGYGGDGGYGMGGGPPAPPAPYQLQSSYQQGPPQPPPPMNYGPPQPPQQPYFAPPPMPDHSQAPPQQGYYLQQPPPPPQPYFQPQQAQPYAPAAPHAQPLSQYHIPPPNQQQQRPPRVASMMSDYGPPSMDSLSLGGGPPRISTPVSTRPSYYAHPEDGPPHKLSVTHPDVRRSLGRTGERRTDYFGLPPRSKRCSPACERRRIRVQVTYKRRWHGPSRCSNLSSGIRSATLPSCAHRFALTSALQSSAGESSRINDPTLVRWTDEALNHILLSAASPHPVPLALYLRGDLSSSGSFPSYRSKDSKSAFRDFEAAANAGYMKAWFRIGRSYEDAGDVRRAVGAYEKGVEKGDCGSTYRLAMAYLLGQIGVVPDAGKAVALLKRAADTADLDTPQREWPTSS